MYVVCMCVEESWMVFMPFSVAPPKRSLDFGAFLCLFRSFGHLDIWSDYVLPDMNPMT